MEHHESLDVRGLCCAEPIIRITRAMKTVEPGQVLLVISDKASMIKDVPAYCSQTHHSLIEQQDTQGQLQFWIRKS